MTSLTRLSSARLGFVLSAWALAGCQPRDRVDAAGESSAVRVADTALAEPSSAIDSTVVADSTILVALDGEGLRFVIASTGSTRLLPFGMDFGGVLTAVTRALGAPVRRAANSECGAGPMEVASFERGLSINAQGGRFVGWSARESRDAHRLTTMSGIGVGATRASLDSSYTAKVSTTSLGDEFSAGGLSGVLDGPASGARITNLWAGTNCIAR